jgi:putative oxygen-independent coproporphyrinogen III oxidase
MTTSLYIHWPFCESKCPYCDFNSHVSDSIQYDKWLTAYLREIEYYSRKLKNYPSSLRKQGPSGSANEINKIKTSTKQLDSRLRGKDKLGGELEIDSIFFGGGTPSLMKPEMIKALLDKVRKEFTVKDNIEITLEANPSSFETEKFKDFKAAGINRVSIGVQSFDENNLKFLGRKHDKKQAIHAIEQAGKIFGNFSFDLIYALPSQNLDNWGKELDYALSFGSPHISLYQLTIEKGTPFYADYHKGKFKLPEEELQTDLYLLTLEKCKAKGLERYEISNFAKRGYESQHNMNYWLQNDYIGIGPGAHGRINELEVGSWKLEEKQRLYPHPETLSSLRSQSISCPLPELHGEGWVRVEQDFNLQTSNSTLQTKRVATMDIHHPQNWLEAVEKDSHGTQSIETLSQKESLEELVFMGLRIREGIKLEKFEEVLGIGKTISSVSSLRKHGSSGSTNEKNQIKANAAPLDPRLRGENSWWALEQIFDQKLLQKLCDEGLMIIDNESIRLTDKGLLLHTGVVKKLIENLNYN